MENSRFILVDKPVGETSFRQVMILRKKLGVKKVGFVGTLDPLASGLLLMATGEYTKLIPLLEGLDKTYRVKIRLGATSDTDDAEGVVIEKAESEFDVPKFEQIQELLNSKFSGEIEQTPPRYSAVQIDGKRAYEMARKGQDFEIKSRRVMINSIEILSFDFPNLELLVDCGSGTYIRSIARDLGDLLGCGGMVLELRRDSIGRMKVEQAITLANSEVADWPEWRIAIHGETQGKEQGKVRLIEVSTKWHYLSLSREQWQFLGNGGELERSELGWQNWPENEPILATFEGKIAGILELSQRGLVKYKRKMSI